MRIGILALQGNVKEHACMLKKTGAQPVIVKKPIDLDNIYGLILPGGESTTISKLLKNQGLDKEIKRKYYEGMPIYGTCAGAILLARNIIGEKLPTLDLLNISIKRNYYGRQLDSFETPLKIKNFSQPFKGIFIRAPVIQSVHNGVEVMAEFDNVPVLVKKENLLASTFHPELTKDVRIHQYFVNMVENRS